MSDLVEKPGDRGTQRSPMTHEPVSCSTWSPAPISFPKAYLPETSAEAQEGYIRVRLEPDEPEE